MRLTRTPETLPTVSGRKPRGRSRRHVGVSVRAIVVAVVALILTACPASAEPGSVLAIASLEQVIDNARNWLVGISSAVATVCLTIAGVRYVIASGDPAEVEKSKSALRAACLGYALAMLAPVIVAVLKSIVGA